MSSMEKPPPDFAEGVAVVVGGSGGIGEGICELLAQAGADVALTYRSNRARAESVAERIRASGRSARSYALDLVDGASVQAAFEAIEAAQGRVHTVIFATGADIRMTYLANVETQEWHDTIASDLHGFFHVVKAALPSLRRGGGSIVALSSAGIDRHPPMDILSVAPKAGIEALVRAVAREEGRYNIRANSVAPGVVDAGLFHRLTTQVTPDFVEAMKRNAALRRFGTVREIAEVVVFLASARAAFVTGQHLAVDGGYSV